MRSQPILVLFAILLITGAPLLGQYKVYNPANSTPEQIEERRKETHPCAEMKSKRESAIKQMLINKAILLDGNQADYDVIHYGIDIGLNFTSQSIGGHVDYRIRSVINGLNAVDLNLHDQLIVDSVKVNGQSAAFSHFNHLLAITTPTTFNQNQEFSMTVYYHGVPVTGGGYADGGMSFAVHGGYQICWTAVEPFASRNWWPCKDYPEDKADSLDLFIEYPAAYRVASNGVIISDDNIGGGRKRVHYKHNYPIVTYLVAISCSTFDLVTKTWNYGSYSMPVLGYTLPNAYDSKLVFDTLTLPMLNIYSDAFGVYPFVNEKLANANCGEWGTMEHQTCSFHDPFAWYYDNVYLLIHENAHQWWGDMITCETFNHIWLNEGFGTYSESIFYEQRFGTAGYFNNIQSQKYLGGGTVYVENIFTDVIFDGNLSYNKGAWVVHMLRGVLGDSVFFDAIKDWAFSSFRYGTATTGDLSTVLSNSVGYDLSWFFNQWIYGAGHPDYLISWECKRDTVNGGYQLSYFIQQGQGGGTYFRMPIRTTFVTTGDYLDTVVWNAGQSQFYSLHFADSVTNIIFDPQEWILRTVQQVPFSMHIATTALPDGEVGTPYFQKLEAVGGEPPYHWSLFGGDIPLGLSFQGDTLGTVSGIPTYPATYYFTLQVNDSDSPPNYESRSYALTINPASLIGDADGSGIINIADVVYLIQYIFAGGPSPDPQSSGDANCNGLVNIADVVYLVSYIFNSGPAPQCP